MVMITIMGTIMTMVESEAEMDVSTRNDSEKTSRIHSTLDCVASLPSLITSTRVYGDKKRFELPEDNTHSQC